MSLKVGLCNPFLEVVEHHVRRQETLAAHDEERRTRLAVPFGKAVKVRDRCLCCGEGKCVAHLVDMLPHSRLV
eukprot:3668933-Pyramimonas_sp.AAC.1